MTTNVPDHLRTLFLGNLPYFCHENDVLYLFQGFGKIESVRLIKNNRTSGGNMGYGFITFDAYQDAMLAASSLHGKPLLGRDIRLALLCFKPEFIVFYS
jgi:RNA recognition motif-containing protein